MISKVAKSYYVNTIISLPPATHLPGPEASTISTSPLLYGGAVLVNNTKFIKQFRFAPAEPKL
jgi:hypothetical protein